MKKEKYILYVIISIASIYFISVAERLIKRDKSPTEMLIEHAIEKAQMKTEIELLNDKIHDYEYQIIKATINVNNMSNDDLDSTWATLFE